MRDRHEVGAGLRRVLDARGCALSAAEGRDLAVALIGLICDGLLVADLTSRLPRTCNTGSLFASQVETNEPPRS
jgi:hypothetical protein